MSSEEKVEKQTVFKDEDVQGKSDPNKDGNKTESGLEENIAGLLCYLAWFITGIIFFVIEKENRFVRFHAMQSIILSVALIAISIFSMILNVIPFLGLIITLLLFPVYLVLWILMMYQAYQGKWFKLPIIGNIALGIVDKEN